MKRKREADLFSLLCQECGRRLIHTESGYLSCPLAHGRLLLEVDDKAYVEEPSLFEEM